MVDDDKIRESQPEPIETSSGSEITRCDACGSPMKPMGHCKYWCLRCGFLRTCNDTV